MKKLAKWTFMVFMAGDNSLSTAGNKDLSEMRVAGSTRKVNIIVEFDNEGDRGTNRYRVKKSGKRERLQSLGETDSGSPEVLNNFIAWSAQNFPAEHYALVLWSHGNAWEPTEVDRIARSVNAPHYNVREAKERSASPLGRTFFRSSLEHIFRLSSPYERAICTDDGSGHSLDTLELGKVLAQTTETLGQPLDLLGMDACLMSNLEVAYQASPYVQYIVASEESEPNDGWPYDQVLQKLVENPELTTADLAAHIVKVYTQSYIDRGYPDPVTQAALNLSKVNDVTVALDLLADALLASISESKTHIWSAQYQSKHFWHNTLWDIAHFSEQLELLSTNPLVRQSAHNVRESLRAGSDCFVISESHHGPGIDHCGGISIYLPALTPISPFYAELDYARNHRWLSLLQAYHP